MAKGKGNKIIGIPKAESDEILQKLFAHQKKSQFVYEHEWRVGDLVMWDNRSLMHRGNTNFDMANEARVLPRTVIIGTKPF